LWYSSIEGFSDPSGQSSLTLSFCRKLPPRVYSRELIEIPFRQPYTRTQFLVGEKIAERKTATNYLGELEKAGILRSLDCPRFGQEIHMCGISQTAVSIATILVLCTVSGCVPGCNAKEELCPEGT
jgi:hypothetical protein